MDESLIEKQNGNFANTVLGAVPSVVYNEDCVEALKRFSDNHFDLAIVDPPYGIVGKTFTNKGADELWEMRKWDFIPEKIYWDELFRVSKNQIVCGGNYFNLPHSRGWVVWDKMQFVETYAPFELFWTSFNNVGKILKYQYSGNYVGFEGKITLSSANKANKKIHPTQKPIQVYEWLLKEFAVEGNLILDTHLGSGSSRIACQKNGFNFTGFEIDKDYYEAQEKRFKDFVSQLRMF